MEKMSIGIVIGQLGGGGAERVASNLCNFFCLEGHSVFVFLVSDYHGPVYPLETGVQLFPLKSSKARNPFSKIRELISCFQRHHLNAVIGFNVTPSFYASEAAKKSHIPFVSCAERNSPQDYQNSLLWRSLKKRSFSLSQKIVFQMEGARDYFPQKFAAKSVIIPNPLSPSFSYIKREYSQIEPVITMIGRVDEQKNYRLALEAFKLFQTNHKKFRLEIYGRADSLYAEALKKEFNDKSIHFLNFLSSTEEILSKTSIFLLSSTFEGISNSLLEALASGVPCVSTDCRPGGSRMLLQDMRGSLLCKNEDQSDMVRCLSMIADNYSDFFKKARSDGLTIQDRYCSDAIGAKWESLIQQIAK